MATTINSSAFDRATQPILGILTSDQAEYEGYIQANRFVAILQAQARRRISSPS